MNLIAVLALSLFSSSVYAIDACAPLLSHDNGLITRKIDLNLWGQKTPVTVVQGPQEHVQINEIIPGLAPTDLVIGLQAGHAYILYKNGRYDGSMIEPMSFFEMGNAKIRHTKLRLAGGIIVRLRGLNPEVQSRLKTFFESERKEFAITCATGVCSVLTRTGIQNLNGISPLLTGNSLLKRLITSQLKNPDGTLISRDVFFYNVGTIDRHRLFDRLIGVVYAIPASAIGIILYLLL